MDGNESLPIAECVVKELEKNVYAIRCGNCKMYSIVRIEESKGV